jgi:glutamine synthetase
MSKSKFLSSCKPSANKDFSTGFGFCSVTFGWDINDSTYIRELLVSNKANGYHDILARVDTSTYRRLAWEKNMPFFLVEFYDPDSERGEARLGACPRGLLETVTQKIEQHGEGWKCMAGAEFEVRASTSPPGAYRTQYFQFDETAQSAFDKKFSGLKPLTPGSRSSPPRWCGIDDQCTATLSCAQR